MIKLKELFETEEKYSGSSFHFLEPTKIPPSKKDVLKGGEEEEQEEQQEEKKDKIQVQGLGVYTPKVIKDKVTRMSIDLRVVKRGDWNKSSRNSIKLGEMWEEASK